MPYFKRISAQQRHAFLHKSKLLCMFISNHLDRQDSNPTLGENFENLRVIEKHEYLNNQDELGLETSCTMLVHPASL